jgi:hypothetical protein
LTIIRVKLDRDDILPRTLTVVGFDPTHADLPSGTDGLSRLPVQRKAADVQASRLLGLPAVVAQDRGDHVYLVALLTRDQEVG